MAPLLFKMHLSATGAIFDKAWEAFDTHFRPQGLGPFLDSWTTNHGDRVFHVGASVPGLPIRNKLCESGNRMFKRVLDHFDEEHATAFREGRVPNPNMRIEDLLGYLLPDGLRTMSKDHTSCHGLDQSSDEICTGNGSKCFEDIFLAGRDMVEQKQFLRHNSTLYAWCTPSPDRESLTKENVTKWLQIQRKKKGHVTWDEMVFFFSIVTFSATSCQCRKYWERRKCRHIVAASLLRHEDLPASWVLVESQQGKSKRVQKHLASVQKMNLKHKVATQPLATTAPTTPRSTAKANTAIPAKYSVSFPVEDSRTDSLATMSHPKMKQGQHHKYTDAYWLCTSDFIYVVSALVGHSSRGTMLPAPYSPKTFEDQLARVMSSHNSNAMTRRRERGRQADPCNTVDSKGVHWVLMVWCVVAATARNKEASVTHHLLDPYANTSHLKKKFPNAKLHGTGHQLQCDGWRCGYIVLWWQIFLYFYFQVNPSVPAFEPERLPRMPDQWEQLIWLLLHARDAQKSHTSSQFQAVFKENVDGQSMQPVIDAFISEFFRVE